MESPLWHDRSDWESSQLPVTGPPLNPGRITHIGIHYTAAVNLPDGDLGEFQYNIPPYLRAIQSDYVRNRNYSIGYHFAVDWLGGIWPLRGWDFKCAANAGANDYTIAILVLVDGNDEATPEAVRAIRDIIFLAEMKAGRRLKVQGHNELDGGTTRTACCGTGLFRQIHRGEFDIHNSNYDPPLETDMSKVHIHNGIRLLDTREDGKGKIKDQFTVAPHGYTPKNAAGVMLHVTVLAAEGDGFVTVWGRGDRPNIAQVSYNAHDLSPRTGFAIVPLNENGHFTVFTLHPAHLIIDQVGLVEAS